jgi:hypothetical protein
VDTLVLPVPILRRLLRLLVDEPRRPLFLIVGIRETSGGRDWLGRRVSTEPLDVRSHTFHVRASDAAADVDGAAASRVAPSIAGQMLLGTGRLRGHISVAAFDGNRLRLLDRVSLVGPGMHTIELGAHLGSGSTSSTQDGERAASERKRWSRTIGALGGEDVWRRLIRLNVTVIGAGRSGSLVAASLARLGVRQLTIVDPDVLELHNLGEADAVGDADVGVPKAIAVARHLRSTLSDVRSSIEPLVASITEPVAIDAAKRSDVIFSCVDHDAPRLAAALIATAHHRVLVDIGTGIFFDPPGANGGLRINNDATLGRRLGADVRLILPGPEGCLLCQGGLTEYERAVRDLTAGNRPERHLQGGLAERAGSLRSLNLMAAGTAVRMLEDLVGGRIDRSIWAHLALDERGTGNLTYPGTIRAPGASPGCRLCARAGLGDLAL